MEQSNLFGYLYSIYVITKPVRNIEFFAGVSTFAMALRDLEVDYEPWKICEWDVNAIASNKAIHHGNDKTDYSANLSKGELQQQLYELGLSNDGKSPMKLESIKRKNEKWLRETYNNIKATKNLVDITKVRAKDLEIVDTDKYCYILTYSFPCQDLSKAGKQLGMAKDSGTRSSMLWQFERIMIELHEMGIHPDVLIMENVPDVVGTKNIKYFNDWYAKLETLGYQSYYKNLNAKNYGIPQNRDRCFMVSIYGDYNYDFPQEIPLETRLKDVLEPVVDEKYYISDDRIKIINLKNYVKHGTMVGFSQSKREGHVRTYDDIACTLTSRDYHDPRCVVVGETNYSNFESANRIFDTDGLCPTLNTMGGGNLEPKIVEPAICASRGRNPNNLSSQKSGEPTEQVIEVNASGCSNTLTTVQKDNYVIEPVCLNSKVNGKQPSIQDRIYDPEAISTAITTSFMPNIAEQSGIYANRSKRLDRGCLKGFDGIRIRKLTPLECWRLMGYTDDDFYKAATVNSNSQLYKQAGNGIVKQVAMAIFSAMLEKKEK